MSAKMAEPEKTDEEPPKKASKLPLILGLVLSLAGGAGAFFYMYSSSPQPVVEEVVQEEKGPSPIGNVAFVPLTPIVVALGDGPGGRLLRFQAQLEVEAGLEDEVAFLEPRIIDVLNTYLRAVDVEDLQSRRALIRLRAQMLRRVQVVTGGSHVLDLLITEFVLT